MPNDLTPSRAAQSRAAARQPRISSLTREAISLIVHEGVTQRTAAQRVGMNERALSRALKKPHVAEAFQAEKVKFAQEVDELKAIAKKLAISTGLDLMQNSKSDSVKARMVEFFAGEAKKGNEINVQTAVHIGSGGYEFAPHGAEIVEVQPTQDSTSGAPDSQEPENKDKSD